MSSRTKQFLPMKMEVSNWTGRTKPEDYEPVIRESFDSTRKMIRKLGKTLKRSEYLPYDYQGRIEKRRKEALRRSLPGMMERIRERYAEQFKGEMNQDDALLAWIELNMPIASYTQMEQQYHTLWAAAIWMLDRITEQERWRRKLFPLLPKDNRAIEEFLEPDIWDCQYEYDLIASVVHVLYYRNLTDGQEGNEEQRKKGKKGTLGGPEDDPGDFDERCRLHDDNPYVLTSEYAAAHELGENWRDVPERDGYRERFRALLSLIPQEEIDKVVGQFYEGWSRWIDQFYTGAAAFCREREHLRDGQAMIAEEHNALVDELEMLIDSMEEQRRAKTVRKNKKPAAPAANPLVMNPLQMTPPQGKVPGIEQLLQQTRMGGVLSAGHGLFGLSSFSAGPGAFGLAGGKTGIPDLNAAGVSGDDGTDAKVTRIENLYSQCLTLEDRYNELVDEMNKLNNRERIYSLQMGEYGRISDNPETTFAGLSSAVRETMQLDDPYALSFALLYLIEKRDDRVWLFGAGHGFARQICEALPWGIGDYDEMEDPIWDNPKYQWKDVPKSAAVPDWNERKYADRESQEYYWPRSLAQILYEETGCLLPRDLKCYYPEYETIRDYGLKGKEAGLMLLMAATLGTAKRQLVANNFNAEYLRLLEEIDEEEKAKSAQEEQEEKGEPGAEGADGEVGQEAGGREKTEETGTGEEARAISAEPEDERDRVISQLREELKKAWSSLHAAEVETRNVRKELASAKNRYERERRELADLREIVFNAQFEGEKPDGQTGNALQPAAEQKKIEFPYETNRRTTVFGGHETFLKAIRPMLPKVRFIDSGYMNFSQELIRNSDIVWIQTNCISHPMFWNVVKYAKQYGVQLRYFLQASAEKCAQQIAEADGAD